MSPSLSDMMIEVEESYFQDPYSAYFETYEYDVLDEEQEGKG